MESLSQQVRMMNSENDAITGSPVPRIFTPPLRELNEFTSYGFDLIEFAENIGMPLDPWEKWAAIHFGELLEDGTPRFRFVLILVARQNGKTTLCRILTLYWMFIECQKLIYAISTSRDTAKVSWQETMAIAESNELLLEDMDPVHRVDNNGSETFFNRLGSQYRFGAPNRRAGRSFTVNRAIIDEIREHKSRDAYNALINAGNAVSDFQAVAISNQGDTEAIVLDEIRTSAIEYLETGSGDPRLFLAEWSSPAGSDPTDIKALASANPNLGIRIIPDALLGQAIQAKRAGGKTLADFKTEVMCQKVTLLDPAIEPEKWKECGTTEPINMADHRRYVALCLDVSLSGDHATVVACLEHEGKYHFEVIKVWQGFGCTAQVRAELPDLVAKVKPRAIGWYPGGPAASIAADLRAKSNWNKEWPPRNVKVIELKAESIPAVCMGLADIVHAGEAVHPNDEMLTTHINQTQKLRRADLWTYTRGGIGPVDGTYATAGALHLTRTLPAPLQPVSTGRES